MRSLDTSVAIDHLRGHEPATKLLDRLLRQHIRVAASEVVRFEVLAGMRPEEDEATERFFAAVDVVPVTEPVSRRAAHLAQRYRASHSGIGTADYLIAATAQVYELPLLSRNLRHFPMLDGLQAPY